MNTAHFRYIGLGLAILSTMAIGVSLIYPTVAIISHANRLLP